MAAKAIKILIIEDIATDAELIEYELNHAQLAFNFKRVETKEEYVRELQLFKPDIILSDYSLPRFNALEALKIKNEQFPHLPFILVTGAQTEEIAANCIKQGADDYILKSSLIRLPTSVHNALQKKKAEKEYEASINEIKNREEKYRNLFENSLIGMFRMDAASAKFIEVNEKAKKILGNPFLEGTRLYDIKLCKGEFEKDLSNLTQIENKELQIIRPDNSLVWISVSAKKYEKEDIIEGVIKDITQSKTSYIELEKMNYELDRFTYHASHDLKSPLRSIEGLIQMAKEETSLEVIHECLDFISKSVNRMEELIEDLLSVAKTKKAEPKITSIDFKKELEDALAILQYVENFNKIKFNIRINQNGDFFSDAVRLRIIWNNLVSNAVKYHNYNQEYPCIEIEINVSNGRAEIIIRDNGRGISENAIPKIFDMFYRATNDIDGSGLGLYLVKMTVEKLGGKITVKSKPFAGTTFYISLPDIYKECNVVASGNVDVPSMI